MHVTLGGIEKSLWAKTGGGEESHLWMPLYVHLADSAELVRLLWREWLSSSVRSYLCESAGLEDPAMESLLAWLAGVHDIGKAIPAFQSKVPHLAETCRNQGLPFPSHSRPYSHAFAGEIIVQSWLESRAVANRTARSLASIVGGHHGRNPNPAELRSIGDDDAIEPSEVLGAAGWLDARDSMLGWVTAHTLGADGLAVLQGPLPAYAQILITGVVIVTDWMASNTFYFPLVEETDGWRASRARAEEAWRALDLPHSFDWRLVTHDPDELFHRRFVGLPHDAHLRGSQRAALHAVRNLSEPSMVIIEAPMGEGKTEASLLCAELMAEKFGCNGLCYLLPTQATSNAMFERVEAWLKSALQDQPVEEKQDIRLLHSKAELNERFQRLTSWNASWMGDGRADDDRLVAHQWFSGSKRGLLSTFVVGTVDQLLMAALKTKHVHLRQLGLAGKVVVIDEVHAYDAYMSTYLRRVLAFLGHYGVPVILLSATLSPLRRGLLLEAYRGKDTLTKRATRALLESAPKAPDGSPAYPLVSMASRRTDEPVSYIPCEASSRATHVRVEFMEDDDETLLEMLSSSLEDGGCACVLRDTVARAQHAYHVLKQAFPDEVLLVHARFIALDRAHNDQRLLDLLGPDGSCRPQRLIVVSTQVVEQSLDLDFDLLVTDVAPIDLLLQRMGRLHRHVRKRPRLVSAPRCAITGIKDLGSEPPAFARGIETIYDRYLLLRTVLALDGTSETVDLPADIASLVELVYEGELALPPAWRDACETARAELERKNAQRTDSAGIWLLAKPSKRASSLDGWMQESLRLGSEVEGRAAVRDSEESFEVVLIQESREGYELLPWIAEAQGIDSSLGTGADVPSDPVARAAALCTVALPLTLVKREGIQAVAEALESVGASAAWGDSRWLRGHYPLVVNGRGEAVIAVGSTSYAMRYTREMGLEMIQERGNEA